MSDYCVIPLGKNGQYEAKVSQEDYAALTKWCWNYKKSSWKYGQNIYARRGGGRDRKNGGNKPTILMHAYILETLMGVRRPDELATVDHRNRDKLDNRRENLRWASKSEQSSNQKPRITKSEKAAYEQRIAA